MPKAFESCVKRGGKVRTITSADKIGKRVGLAKGEYMHVCFKGGKMFLGEKKHKSPVAAAIGRQ